MGWVLKFPGIKEDVSMHVQTKNHVSGLLRMQVISGASTVLSLPYPTTDYDSQTRAKLIKRSTKVLHRLNETLKNADLHENFCACSKLFFWTSVLCRSDESQTRAKLIKRSTKVLHRLNETLKNADLHENFCACSKLFFWTSVLRRSPTKI